MRGLILFLEAFLINAQICNRADPNSGGLVIPAFFSGGSQAAYPNGTTAPHCTVNASSPTNEYEYGCVPPIYDVQVHGAIVYFMMMIYVFLGLAVNADFFMSAIEVITCQSKVNYVSDPKTGKYRQVVSLTWNPLLANLTIITFGGSGPELLLSFVDSIQSGFYAGDLGPGIIVGSAAFNLLVITAMCSASIPWANLETGEPGVRRVTDRPVYIFTAVFSLLSYVWLIIILVVISPNLVELWEAAVTCLLFPLFVWLTYRVDLASLDETLDRGQGDLPYTRTHEFTPDELVTLLAGKAVRMLSPEEAANVARYEYFRKAHKSNNLYRIDAVRQYLLGQDTGVFPKNPQEEEKQMAAAGLEGQPLGVSGLWDEIQPDTAQEQADPAGIDLSGQPTDPENAKRASLLKRNRVGFTSDLHTVWESDGAVALAVERRGDLSVRCDVPYRLVPGTAKPGEDFVSHALSDLAAPAASFLPYHHRPAWHGGPHGPPGSSNGSSGPPDHRTLLHNSNGSLNGYGHHHRTSHQQASNGQHGPAAASAGSPGHHAQSTSSVSALPPHHSSPSSSSFSSSSSSSSSLAFAPSSSSAYSSSPLRPTDFSPPDWLPSPTLPVSTSSSSRHAMASPPHAQPSQNTDGGSRGVGSTNHLLTTAGIVGPALAIASQSSHSLQPMLMGAGALLYGASWTRMLFGGGQAASSRARELQQQQQSAKLNELRRQRLEGVLHFEPGQSVHVHIPRAECGIHMHIPRAECGQSVALLSVALRHDKVAEYAEDFFLQLEAPISEQPIMLEREVARVLIVDDDALAGPGTIELAATAGPGEVTYVVSQNCGAVQLRVVRRGGSTGEVSVQWRTKAGTAVPDHDYIEAKGTLTFAHGQVSAFITVYIVDDETFEKEEYFTVLLTKATGCELGGLVAAEVHITDDDATHDLKFSFTRALNMNLHQWQASAHNYRQQLMRVCNWPHTGLGQIMHLISLPWNLAISLTTPPALFCGGWPAYVFAFSWIAFLCVLLSDAASLFACAAGIDPFFNAITFLAVGTSVPDVFAARVLAKMDPTANASVGKVAGSNVFLVIMGLGLPFLMCAIYWEVVGPTQEWVDRVGPELAAQYPEGGYVVPAGDLGFSVTLFIIAAILCYFMLELRRAQVGGELGGTGKYFVAVYLLGLWAAYIALSYQQLKGTMGFKQF